MAISSGQRTIVSLARVIQRLAQKKPPSAVDVGTIVGYFRSIGFEV